jgi:hypothetical protein
VHAETDATITAIRSVRNPRFLATERGFQGGLYCALRSELEKMGILSKRVILEMEYQKSWRHGTYQRPDIVLHIPAEISGESPEKNNYAVWALKRAASAPDAEEDFEKLDEMRDILHYPLLIFVNVGSGKNAKTRLDLYKGENKELIHAFGVPGPKGAAIKHSYFEHGVIKDETYLL